jgi:ABC-type branched-subunit amino acid transport system permease subunit
MIVYTTVQHMYASYLLVFTLCIVSTERFNALKRSQAGRIAMS